MTRRLTMVVVLVATALAACTPVKTPPPTPGRSIAYYYVEDFLLPADTGSFRSVTPFTQPVNGGAGAASQTLNSDGTVMLNISNAGGCPCGGAFTGFYTPLFRLGDLVNTRVRLAPGSSPVEVNLVIDQSGDGEWGQWGPNGQSTGFVGDETALGPVTGGGYVEVNDSRQFELDQAGGVFTLGELKAGAAPGIDANTRVALLVFTQGELLNPFDANSVVTSIVLNGVELLT